MKRRVHLLVTLFTIGPLGIWAIVAFADSVDLRRLHATLLTLSETQIAYLLVVVVSIILLHELLDARILRRILNDEYGVHPTRGSLQSLWEWPTAFALVVFGVIPFLDLIGSFPEERPGLDVLAPKIALVLLASVYLYHVVDRPGTYRKQIHELLTGTGAMRVLTRQEDHDFMAAEIDAVPAEQRVYVTHFEEPRNGMHPDGFYYEAEFMQTWYATAREKRLRIQQVVLVNSNRDVVDLERRLELTTDCPFYNIACIVAPRLTVFMDFMVMPHRFALLGFSDNPTMRNMNEFSVLVTEGPAIERFEHLFTDVLLPEAIHVKTFEGIDRCALELVRRLVSEGGYFGRAA